MSEEQKIEKKEEEKSAISKWIVALLVKIETFWDEFLVKKAPITLPREVKRFIPNIAQPLAFIIAVLLFIGIFKFNWASIVYLIAFFVMRGSIKPLGDRKIDGWRWILYASLLIFVAAIVDGALVESVVLTFLAVYLLFQIKSEYK